MTPAAAAPPAQSPRPTLRRVPWTTPVFVLPVAATFVLLFGSVLAGRVTLIGGDILFNFLPWSAEPGAHPPRNTYVGDPVTQFVPWLGLVKSAFADGDLPLWNPFSFAGTPLLANDQSSPFSPFTLVALLFGDPARGLSIAMLIKLWVAGVGTALFLRVGGAGAGAAVFGGVSYATSSFMVVWLAYPHTAVASLLPWLFLAVEWFLKSRRPEAAAAVALAVGLQFLAGHAETSLHLGVGVAVYVVVRLVQIRRQWLSLFVWLGVAAGLGTLLAAVQLLPFVSELAEASLMADRGKSDVGFVHLEAGALDTWIVPNAKGSPGVSGKSDRYPVYPESVGFAGVGALVLAVLAFRPSVVRRHPVVVALAATAAVVGGVIYGPLSPIAGRAPMLELANNIRFFVVACFAVSALAGFGAEGLLGGFRDRRWRPVGMLPLAAAGAGLVCLALFGVLVADGTNVDVWWVLSNGMRGFWVAAAALALGTVGALLLARFSGLGSGPLALGLILVALAEAALFAFPYNPRVPPSEVPPRSEAVDWLEANGRHTGVAALGLDLIPDSSAYYDLRDARGVDVVIDERVREYWSRADPGYNDDFLYTTFARPDTRWLAAAGIGLVLTAEGQALPGTAPAYEQPGVTISSVPEVRPFAYAATRAVAVRGLHEAAGALRADPLGIAAIERPDGRPPPTGRATVRVVRRTAGSVTLDVMAESAASIVVLQSFDDGWAAEIDGEQARLFAANILFQAVEVPRGRHRVTLRYVPREVGVGVAASVLGAAAVAGLAITPALMRRRRSGTPSGPRARGSNDGDLDSHRDD